MGKKVWTYAYDIVTIEWESSSIGFKCDCGNPETLVTDHEDPMVICGHCGKRYLFNTKLEVEIDLPPTKKILLKDKVGIKDVKN